MEIPFEFGAAVVTPQVSAGLAGITSSERSDANERELLLWKADKALYCAKSAGRGRWKSFDPEMMIKELAERSLVSDLQIAVTAGQFEVFYQPILNIESRVISGLEALVRWKHPTRGLLNAAEFMPVVEETGLIVPLGLWVLRRACADAARWPDRIRILVNLSPRQLASSDLVVSVEQALDEAGILSSRLELEITETSIMQSTERTEQTLRELRALGVDVALDDFGTGYSSLSHIRTLQFDTIKIDRSFVAEAPSQNSSGAIVRAVSALARDLGIRTIAEGVESEEQLAWLQAIGCDEAQGYLFSRPIPSSYVPELLSKHCA